MSRKEETRLVYSTDTVVGASKKAPRERERQPPQPEPKGVRIRLERRAGNRLGTVVTGLTGSEAQLLELTRTLKSACGTGGTFKDGVLELQGDKRNEVEAVLKARGIPSKRSGG